MTILKGRLNPEIDDSLSEFYNAIEANSPQPWPIRYVEKIFSEKHLNYLREFETAAFLVIQNDTLRFEYYADGFDEQSMTNSWSMAKSVISLLISSAMDDQLIHSLDDRVGDYLAEFKENKQLTIRHLLMMSSGINHDESYINPFYYPARALYGKDLEALVKEYHMVDSPGVRYTYKSGDTQLLALILKKVTGRSISEYATEKIWSKIGAEYSAKWDLDKANGIEKAFCCIQSSSRDYARLGQLILNEGIWNGDTIINPEYVRIATTKAPLEFEAGVNARPYGYQFWILQQPGYKGVYFRGFKGQYIMVLPSEDMVVVRLGRKEPYQPKVPYFLDQLEYIDMARSLVK
jgi:CubicO group peptidase (beta-lactamase class C family)